MPHVDIHLDIPDVFKGSLLEQKYQATAQRLLQEQTVLRLYQDGEISTGTGAKLLGLSIYDFIQFLGRHQVSIFQLSEDALEADVAAAEMAYRQAQ